MLKRSSQSILRQYAARWLPFPLLWVQYALLMMLPITPNLPRAQAAEEGLPPVLSDNMGGPQKALKSLGPISGLTIHEHSIDEQHYSHGNGAEHIRFSCPAGASAKFAYHLPPTPIIEESKLSVAFKSNRVGTRLAALVVLPRTKDSQTGKPVELLLRGQTFGSAGNWQELVFENLIEELRRQARVARMQHGKDLDEREAFVSHVVVLAPGGPGTGELIVDRIQVFGVINAYPKSYHNDPQVDLASRVSPNTTIQPPHNATFRPKEPQRVIRWQGEEFQYLANLGFDGVQIGRPPTSTEVQEAQRLGLALVCTPPDPQHLTESGIKGELSSVSVWDIGEQYTKTEMELTQRWHHLIKKVDPNAHRPVMISAGLYPREASRIGDQLLLKRPLLYSDLTFREYAAWLSGRQRLARPGTPIWTSIETQLPEQVGKQVQALFPSADTVRVADYSQLVAMTSVAIAAKSRGFYFESHSSLAKQDPSTKLRTLNMELLNQRLKLISPWLSKGKLRAGARSNHRDLSALVVQVERSHLLIPIRWSNNLHSNDQATAELVSFVVPEAIESSEAYLLTLAGPQRIRHERVTGGIRVSIDQLPEDALILLTDDQQAFTQISRYLRSIAPRATQICRELTLLELQQTNRTFQELGTRISGAQKAQQLLGQSQRELQLCDQFLAKRDFLQAYQKSFEAKKALDECRSLLLRETNFDEDTQLAVISDSLQLNQLTSPIKQSQNRLIESNFEDLPSMLEAGWKQQRLEFNGVESAVRLAPQAPHSGKYCLELEAKAATNSPHAVMIPSAPVWITSPNIPVREGDLIEISGYARVPRELLGTVDGFQILDSLGGPAMAHRISLSPNWTPFRILRKATNNTDLKINLVLSGIGKAQVDDLAVRSITPLSQPNQAQAYRSTNPNSF